MHTIQLDIPDELAERLAPYSDRLAVLLELGLQAWMAHEQQEHGDVRQELLRLLATSGKVPMPQPYPGPEPYGPLHTDSHYGEPCQRSGGCPAETTMTSASHLSVVVSYLDASALVKRYTTERCSRRQPRPSPCRDLPA